MGFASTAEVVDAHLAGKEKYTSWRKVPVQVTTAGSWFDLSMSPGNPVAQYYAATPVTTKALYKSTDGGIEHGGAVSPATKHLRKLMALSVVAGQVPMVMYLCDYVMYYPFVDMGFGTGAQAMTNSITLPRWDGANDDLQVMAVTVAAGGFAADTFTFTYTNSDGDPGRVSPLCAMNTANSATGTLLTSQTTRSRAHGPFLPLQAGDHGVQSIQSVTLTSGVDTGLFTLVLVKPLATISLRGIDAPVEVDFLTDKGLQLPEIPDDAYLNFIVHPAGAIAGQLLGDATFIWT